MKKKNKIVVDKLMDEYEKIIPKCPHFEKCGGCLFQNIDYKNQILLKEKLIESLITKKTNKIFDNEIKKEFLEIIEGIDLKIKDSKKEFRYRTKIEMVCNNDQIGFREKNKFDSVVDIKDCYLFDEKTFKKFLEIKKDIIESIKEFPFYDLKKHNGFLRYIIIRKGYQTDEDMITFVTNGYIENFWRIIDKSQKIFNQVSWLINTTYSDVAKGEEFFSSGNIKEKIGENIYSISNSSFFQSNSFVTKDIYDDIKHFSKGQVIDLFGGTSTIGLYVAKKDEVSEVLTVDILKENIEIAQLNKEENKDSKVKLLLKDAKDFFREEHQYDTLIIDPPRTGLEKKLVKKILSKKINRFIYMSCNFATFLDDIEYIIIYRKEFLQDKKIKINFFKAYDMFPQTPHFETLCVIDFI
ncbi:MAG: methyltransferase [Candidatus Nanoarchaeia archaeon]|nr:methyltransferase [Candidatus Nanoarchaeia archaeon]